MSNILVYGANGFVGTAAASYFLKQGHHVIGLVKDVNNKTRRDVLDKCSIVTGDVRDKEIHPYLLSKYEVDYVLYLAAQPIVRICNADPYTAYMTNVVGTLNFLEAVRTVKHKIKKVVLITSDKAFGKAPIPYTEDTPLVPADSYCTSKACQDFITTSYANTYGLPICVVRAGNLFGPGDLNLSRLIPGTITKLLAGQAPTLYTGVANYLREFIYIDNILVAFDLLLQKGIPGEAYNVGGTEPHHIGKVMELIRDKIDPRIGIEMIEKDFYEIPEQRLDATKLTKLGWNPPVKSLDEGIDKTIEWFRGRQWRLGQVI